MGSLVNHLSQTSPGRLRRTVVAIRSFEPKWAVMIASYRDRLCGETLMNQSLQDLIVDADRTS